MSADLLPEDVSETGDLAHLLGELDRLENTISAWDDTHRATALAYAGALEALHGIALRRLISALKSDPAAAAALKSAAGDEMVYAVLRRHNILKPSLNERLEAALDSVRPALASHGGDVALVRIDPPAIDVRFIGACDGCSASQLTFQAGVRKAIQEACPEITEIRQVKGVGGSGAHFVSPFSQVSSVAWLEAGAVADIPENGVRALVLAGESLLLAQAGGKTVCYSDTCAHMGLPLAEGSFHDGVLECPHHGFAYDLATGVCLTAPDMRLRAHRVRVTDGRIAIQVMP